MLHSKKGGNLQMQMVVINDNRFAVEERNGNISFNLTMMAKPFGRSKRPSNWLRTEFAQSYLAELSDAHKCASADLVEVRKGGTIETQGTWANDARIAVRFAQFLDMKLAVAVDELIYKLLTKQAMVVEPFKGVSPLVDGHQAWYCYLDVLKAIGNSTTSGSVSERKRRYPHQFKMFFGRNFISREFCEFLQKTRELRQLQLDLFNDQKSLQ